MVLILDMNCRGVYLMILSVFVLQESRRLEAVRRGPTTRRLPVATKPNAAHFCLWQCLENLYTLPLLGHHCALIQSLVCH